MHLFFYYKFTYLSVWTGFRIKGEAREAPAQNSIYEKLPLTTMTQDRLSVLSILSFESNIINSLDFEDVIKQFSFNKSRKVRLI